MTRITLEEYNRRRRERYKPTGRLRGRPITIDGEFVKVYIKLATEYFIKQSIKPSVRKITKYISETFNYTISRETVRKLLRDNE